MATQVGEVIRAVAEGATGGMRALREAGLNVTVDAFDVEVDYVAGPDHHGAGEVSATLRVRLNAECTERAELGVPDPAADLEHLMAQPS